MHGDGGFEPIGKQLELSRANLCENPVFKLL